jgi:thiol-disulfide isomerase/thioredoxin
MSIFGHRRRLGAKGRLPGFNGATGWLNSEPLGLDDVRDHVVLVNFWTFTCINWLRQEPYVRAWSQAYRDDGLVVIGVHTPEFSFEHEPDRVRRAVEVRGIDYPVALDNDYDVWRAFSNQYWPALYFVDRSGVIRDEHFGEGRYEESEGVLQELLGIERDPQDVRGVGVEAEADWAELRSPETYVGAGQGEPSSSVEGLQLNRWALAGEWSVERERVVLDQPGGSIAFRFRARDANLVLSPGARAPMPFRLLVDGEAPGVDHGVDVDEDGNGVLTEGRLYQLVRQSGAVAERTLELTFQEAGAEAYVFTFG